jgi:hypothetical protein
MKTNYKIKDRVYIYNKKGLHIINKDNIGIITNIETEYEDNGSHNSGDEIYYTITKVNGEIYYTKHDSDFTILESYIKYMEIESKEVIRRAEERKSYIDDNIKEFTDCLG